MSHNQYPNQYPYNYNYQQHTPGPPQPSWQQPPRRFGWGDPRIQQQPQANTQSPISAAQPGQFGQPVPGPPPPPAQPPPSQYPYSPHHYSIPQPAASQYDTSSWGVKYNQQQQQQQQYAGTTEHRPSVTPRPPSAAAQSSGRPEQNQAPQDYHQVRPGPHIIQQQQPVQWQQGGQWQTPQDIPPPRPPRPPEYAGQASIVPQQNAVPHGQYAHQQPIQHNEPKPQPQTPQQAPILPGHIAFQYAATPGLSGPPQTSNEPVPVSPIQNQQSRWDTSRPSHDPDYIPSIMQAPATPGEQQFYASALGKVGAPSDWEHFGDSQTVSPEASSPPSAHALPIKTFPPNLVPQTPQKPSDQDNSTSDSSTKNKSSSFVADGIQRTGTIDSVIQAWSAPLERPSGSAIPQHSQSVSQNKSDSSQYESQQRTKSIGAEKIIESYSDLKPEYRASLKRYANMLQREEAAETGEDKFHVFQSFVNRELKLRTMFYGVEPTPSSKDDGPSRSGRDRSESILTIPLSSGSVNSQPAATAMAAASAKDSEPKERPTGAEAAGIASNAKPEPVSKADELNQATKQPPVPSQPTADPTNSKENAAVSQVPSENVAVKSTGRSSTPPASADLGRPSTPDSWEDFRGENESDDEHPEYSPGGRPVIKRPSHVSTDKTDASVSKPTAVPGRTATPPSPGANAPMVLSDYIMAQPPSPKTSIPSVSPRVKQQAADNSTGDVDGVSRQQLPTPSLKFEPDRPVYTPFRYSTAAQTPAMPVDQSYSSLRKDAEESDRFLKHESIINIEPPSRSSTPSAKRPDETFVGLIRQQSKLIRKPPTDQVPILQVRPSTPAAPKTAAETSDPDQDRRVATATLRASLPSSLPEYDELAVHPDAKQLKVQVDAIQDNFSFIHTSVVAWDRKNREVRKKQDAERSSRQAESEQRIDELFNDNQIGYSDIGNLEAEFKLSEAKRKYEEDQQELVSFTDGVYDIVTERLERQQSDLESHYTTALNLLDNKAEAASRCFANGNEKAKMTYVLDLVMSIFDKLEVRHQKLAEADVERERRRKRLELTVLYVNGDTKGVKDLEQEFAKAEKLEVLHKARGKDDRANKLMDAVDKATVRGLGDNQTYIDELLIKVKKVRDLTLKDTSNPPTDLYDSDGPRSSLSLAQETVDMILADSQKLLITSNIADKLLNDADYAVSVANASVSNADTTTYQKLAQEKEKEDAKIVEDTNSRLSSISKGPEEAIATIREVVDRVGDDPAHQERIKKALEAAKRRNTVNLEGSDPVDND